MKSAFIFWLALISLCPDDAQSKREKYIENVSELLRSMESKKQLLILTSCNWTKDELVKQFQERKHSTTLLHKGCHIIGLKGFPQSLKNVQNLNSSLLQL